MNKQQEQKEDWFTNVENLKPIRGGRRAANLNSVANNDLRVTNKEAEEKFRADWEVALQSEDPLKDLWHYIIWFDEHFPAGKPHLLYPMLYKICTKFGTATRYQHDERLLKFWILLAENFPERGLAVFDFAYKRGSCNTMAKFYVRWSEMYEKLGNSTKAREMLDFGLQNRATPITVIHEARERLEMRLMFITLQKTQLHDLSDYEERDMDQDDDILATNAPRQQLAKLEGVGEHLEAPMFRIPKGSTGMLQMQQTNINASFEIYEDEPEVSQTLVVAPSSNKTGRIAEEFEDDPEYQALFGFFDHRSRTDIHLNISENVRKPTQTFGLKDLPELPVVGDDFEVFTEETNEDVQQQKTRNPPCKKQKSGKIRLCLSSDIGRNKISIEEAYAEMIENDNRV